MLRLLVSPQVHLSLETFPAEVAAERLEPGVFPAVRDEVGALTEGLPAHLTLVRLLTCSGNVYSMSGARFTHYARGAILRAFCFDDIDDILVCAVSDLCG